MIRKPNSAKFPSIFDEAAAAIGPRGATPRRFNLWLYTVGMRSKGCPITLSIDQVAEVLGVAPYLAADSFMAAVRAGKIEELRPEPAGLDFCERERLCRINLGRFKAKDIEPITPNTPITPITSPIKRDLTVRQGWKLHRDGWRLWRRAGTATPCAPASASKHDDDGTA